MEDVSDALLGRYQALRAYAAIGRLPKPEFTTGQISGITGIPTSALSKELTRLVDLKVIVSRSRRGDYQRLDVPNFWDAIELLAGWAETEHG